MGEPRPLILTVVVWDASPICYQNEPCSHRTVHVMLTDAQCAALALGENEGYGTTYVEHIRSAEVHCAP